MFEQVLKLALQLGAMKLGRVAIDGSKMKANPASTRAMSYQRLQDEEKRLRRSAALGNGRIVVGM